MSGKRQTLLPILACAAALTGCAGKGPVTVGVVAPLSGQWDLYGRPIVNGIELAHEQLAADPTFPRPIELAIRDSASDPKKAGALLREVYEDAGALVAIAGVTTPEALEMIPVIDDEEKVLISPSATSPRLTGISQFFFRVVPSDFREGAKMGNFVAQELDIDRVVILAAESPYAKGIQDVFKSEFERYGGEVLAVIEYPTGSTDFSQYVREALSHQPEAVYVADYAYEIGSIINLLKGQGFINGRILTTHAFAAPGVFDQVGTAAEGVLLTQVVFDPDGDEPVVRRFADAYHAKHGTKPDSFAAHGYDAMMVVGAVLRAGDIHSARDFYKDLRNLRDFVGAAGPVQFDEKGDVGKFPRVYAIQDGELVDFETVIEERKKEIQRRLDELRQREREAARRAAEGQGAN
jgi:branched-chain amino acid transport system substrate-binding protein